jgi:16S rRNA (cytosine967-C5)-methyltransferase
MRINYLCLEVGLMAPSKGKENPAGQLSSREAALKILKEVEEKGAYVNLVLNRVISSGASLTDEERSLLTKLSHGVCQRLNTLDWVLALYLDQPLEKLTIWIRNILRMGAYQILYLEKIPDAAAVNEAVKLAQRYGHRGVAGLVNAVLRKISRNRDKLPWPSLEQNPEQYLSLRYSYPPWMVRRWINNLGLRETEAFCAASNHVPPLTIRTNTLRVTRKELKKILQAQGVKVSECLYAPEGLELRLAGRLTALPSFQEGLFQVQSEASMLVAPLLNPQPGEAVLDLCSAPGGKAIHLGILMRNEGIVVASDFYPHRLQLVERAARHQGASIIVTEKMDGRSLPREKRSFFDRVLLDAPCSGLGVLRRKTDLKWARRPEDIAILAQLQFELLQGAFSALRPGGVLLYSACTTEPEETTAILDKFLHAEPAAQKVLLSPFLPEGLKNQEKEEGMLFFWPQSHGLDGFFLAKLRKG